MTGMTAFFLRCIVLPLHDKPTLQAMTFDVSD